MFDRLKKLFKRAEKEVAEKVEQKIDVTSPAELEERLAPEVLEAMREVEAEKARAAKRAPAKEIKPLKEVVKEEAKPAKKPEKPKVERVEKPIKIEKPKVEEAIEEEVPIEEVPEKAPEVEEVTPEEVSYGEAKAAELKKAEERKGADERVGKKIRFGLGARIKTALGAKARLSESEIGDITWNLQMGLMESDVAMEVADAITAELKQKLSSAEFKDPRGQVRGIFKETLVDILEAGGKLDFFDFIKKHQKPVNIVFFGINGCGKTTTVAKLAHQLKGKGFSVIVAAGDTFRAGAQEQLGKHAERVGVEMIHHQRGGDAAAVIFDAVKHANAESIDIVLADTSGRMQSDTDLMGEMEKIVRVNKPDLKIFVGDALTGNDAVEQARVFNDRIGIDASILAKCDASKGGAALSVSYITKKPIAFLGMGQGYDDLKPFDARQFVDEII
jgi:fused signal recognition particle receptor